MAADELDWADGVVVGRIARTHGRRGEVIVNPDTDFPDERYRKGAVFLVRCADLVESKTVQAVRFHRGRPIVALEGVGTIDEAQAFVGAELRVPAWALRALPAGMFYRHELIGCAVETSDGTRLGSVVAVQGDVDGSRLVVRRASDELLVPLVDEICRRIDPVAGTIEIDPPDGLLDLNVTKRSRSAR